MSRTTPQGHKKRSGIPIAPSETESAAGRDDAKRPPPSPMRRDCRGCRERFPRKDPGVFDFLGSSLSCDTTGLTPPLSICAYGLPNRWGVQCSHLKKCERQAGTMCCHTRQIPLKPGSPWKFLQLTHLSGIPRGVTISQLSNRRGCESQAPLQDSSVVTTKQGGTPLIREAKCGDGDLSPHDTLNLVERLTRAEQESKGEDGTTLNSSPLPLDSDSADIP